MDKKKCEYCGKLIRGYTRKHIEYLMQRHQDGKKCTKDKNKKQERG